MTGSILTNSGKIILLNRAYKASPDYTAPTTFKIGILNTEPVVSDTALDRPVPITGTETVDDCEATTGWTGGTDSAVSLNTTTFKIDAGALNIYKSGTAGTVFSASKTTTSVDFTSKDFHIWVYLTALSDLVASGTAIVVRFGSDASNYYYFNTDISALSAGWNLIVFNTTTATGTTGAPTIGACDYTYVAFNTDLAADTVAAGRVVIDDIKVASSGDYTKVYEAGYPSIDESNLEVETQMFLSSTQGNGYEINSLAMFNTDATPKMFAQDVFTAESKGSTDEFIFITKDRVT